MIDEVYEPYADHDADNFVNEDGCDNLGRQYSRNEFGEWILKEEELELDKQLSIQKEYQELKPE